VRSASRGVSAWRALAEHHDGYTDELSQSLVRLAKPLRMADRSAEAIEPLEGALQIRRTLTMSDWLRFSPPLATALRLLAACRAEVVPASHPSSNADLQIEMADQAVGLQRALSDVVPEHRVELSTALRTAAFVYGWAGNHAGGVPLAEEAVTIRRDLYGQYPTTYREPLASALRMFAARLDKVGRSAEAAQARAEASSLSSS
jgi:hypothetical protein